MTTLSAIASYTTPEVIKNYVPDPLDHFSGTKFLGECRIPIFIEDISHNEDTETLKALWIEFQDLTKRAGFAANGQPMERKRREWMPAYTIERIDIAPDFSATIILTAQGKKMLAEKLGAENVQILKDRYKK